MRRGMTTKHGSCQDGFHLVVLWHWAHCLLLLYDVIGWLFRLIELRISIWTKWETRRSCYRILNCVNDIVDVHNNGIPIIYLKHYQNWIIEQRSLTCLWWIGLLHLESIHPCERFKKCILYTPIAFDERVTFWLQQARSLPCVCAFAALYACGIA